MSVPEPMDSLPVSTPPLSPLPSIMIISPPSDLQSPTWNSPWTPNHMAPSTPQRVIAPPKQQYLIVDGYNMIFAWDELKALAKEDLDAARQRLMDTLANYASYKQCRLVLVFVRPQFF